MGELYELFPKLPKNIRQIGERDQVLKLYVEDYVNTYLKQLRPPKGSDLRVGLLLGSREIHEDVPYVFVDGALEMETVTKEGEKVAFTEDAWKKAYQEVENRFPKRTVQGWFLCGNPGCTLNPLNYWREHSHYFTGKNQLMYLNSGLEGEESVYITSSDGFYKLRGYSIYYERNQMMQDYMIARKDVPRAEAGVNDRAIQDFRQKMEERKGEVIRHRNTVGALSMMCTALAITVLAGGVAMFNNYKKMHQMENVIASVLPEGVVRSGLLASGKEDDGKWIEEAAAKVYPSEETARTETEVTAGEKPAAVTPETMEERDNETEETVIKSQAPEGVTEETVLENEKSTSAETVSAPSYKVYTVGEGETLYGICFKVYHNVNRVDEICRINDLGDQNSIYAGQKLLMP